jgi:hypothetical protein
MSIRNKLLAEINKKAQKIREKRVDAASNKTVEQAAFDFFKNIEDSRHLHNGEQYDYALMSKAKQALEERLRAFDNKVKVSVEYNIHEDPLCTDEQTIRGVTIWWSPLYIKKNSCHPSLYIDVSQMLFF